MIFISNHLPSIFSLPEPKSVRWRNNRFNKIELDGLHFVDDCLVLKAERSRKGVVQGTLRSFENSTFWTEWEINGRHMTDYAQVVSPKSFQKAFLEYVDLVVGAVGRVAGELTPLLIVGTFDPKTQDMWGTFARPRDSGPLNYIDGAGESGNLWNVVLSNCEQFDDFQDRVAGWKRQGKQVITVAD